jgi:predicted site-specific integrase-resolvase
MSDALTPKALAEEIGIDAKVLRSFLRKEFPRPVEVKNTTWIIPTDAADKAREKFAKQEAKATTPAA